MHGIIAMHVHLQICFFRMARVLALMEVNQLEKTKYSPTLILYLNTMQLQIQLFQNTPAQFHGRPELVEQMTEELRQQLI